MDDRPIAIITIPYTGTHFMRDHLFARLKVFCEHCWHHTLDNPGSWRKQVEKNKPIVFVPTRHPLEVIASWRRRGRSMADLARYVEVMSRFVGEVMQDLANNKHSGGWYLPIDVPGKRDTILAHINEAHGYGLETDWRVVRQPEAPTGDSELTDEDYQLGNRMLSALPFCWVAEYRMTFPEDKLNVR